MTKTKPSIAVIDDDRSVLLAIKNTLRADYTVTAYEAPETALAELEKKNINIVLLDIRMPSMDGITALKQIKSVTPATEVIMLTALADSKSATSAMKAGAFDYITKPFEEEELRLSLEAALEKIHTDNEKIAFSIAAQPQADNFIGSSSSMTELFSNISKVAPLDSTVLISGETGTGKERVARSIFANSKRKNKVFMAINCAAIPENLFESELFGYERGAFTGALDRKAGRFEVSDGGTVFLDEIGCLPVAMQAKLLRVLQEGEVMRVGGTEPLPVDIRLICATNVDLPEMVKKGTFREDLYYRINVIPLKLPPLTERGEDIILLAEAFVAKFCRKFNKKPMLITEEVKQSLKKYQWPGNVRELENLVERMVALSSTDAIQPSDLPIEIHRPTAGSIAPLEESCNKFEASYIERALSATGGNQTKASELLKVDRTTLISKLKKYSIH